MNNMKIRDGSTCAEGAYRNNGKFKKEIDYKSINWGDSHEAERNRINFMNNEALEKAFSDIAIRQDHKYFLTVTFNKNSRGSDKDLSRFVKIIHQRLYGTRFEKRNMYLGLFIARERQKNFRDHYHILVEGDAGFDLAKLAYAVIHASTKCKSIDDLKEDDYEAITTNNFKKGKTRTDKIHINITEIETEKDLARIAKYVCKDIKFTKGTSICIRQKQSEYDYFPLDTEAAYDYFQRIFRREQENEFN